MALLALALCSAFAPPPEVGQLRTILQQVPANGVACGPRQVREVVQACEKLENAVARPSFPRDLMMVDGSWELRFTSAGRAVPGFVPDALLPPEPPQAVRSLLAGIAEDAPLRPKHISQRINVPDRRIVNCVTLSPWPSGSVGAALASAPGPLGQVLTALSDGSVTLELDHAFSVAGLTGSSGAGSSRIELSLERITRSLEAPPSSPGSLAELIPRRTEYGIPLPLSGAVSGCFETIYVDEQLRVCREGGRPGVGELRVFERVGAMAGGEAAGVAEDAVDDDPWARAAVDSSGAVVDDLDVEELWDEDAGVWRVPDQPSD